MSEAADKLHKLEDELLTIKLRNKRVERDKAWETSWTRRISIMLMTYVVVAAFLYAIETPNFLTAAIVPVVGYTLSTLSLPLVRKIWESRQG